MVKRKERNRLLDLDALNPSIGKVKVGGKKYEMFQPAYADFLMMPILFDKMGSITDLTKNEEKEEKMNEIQQMLDIVKRIIPDLGQDVLTFAQLMKIVEYVSEKFGEQIEEDYGVNKEGADGKGKS